jgi:hypothetical protein
MSNDDFETTLLDAVRQLDETGRERVLSLAQRLTKDPTPLTPNDIRMKIAEYVRQRRDQLYLRTLRFATVDDDLALPQGSAARHLEDIMLGFFPKAALERDTDGIRVKRVAK